MELPDADSVSELSCPLLTKHQPSPLFKYTLDLAALQKVAHPLHMAAWRTNINELQEQLDKPGADPNKRDKVCSMNVLCGTPVHLFW